MVIKERSIVRRLNTNEVYEVDKVVGTILICTPVNTPSLKEHKQSGIPLNVDEVEVLMEEETEVFNLLFREDK